MPHQQTFHEGKQKERQCNTNVSKKRVWWDQDCKHELLNNQTVICHIFLENNWAIAQQPLQTSLEVTSELQMSNSLDCAFIFCSHGWEGWVVVYTQTEQIYNAVIQISAKTGTMHQYTRSSDPWGSPLSSISRQNQSFFFHWNYHMISPLTSKSISFTLPSAFPHGLPLADGNYSLTDSFLRSLSKHRQMGISRFRGQFLQVEQVTKAVVLPEETVQQTLGRERTRP